MPRSRSMVLTNNGSQDDKKGIGKKPDRQHGGMLALRTQVMPRNSNTRETSLAAGLCHKWTGDIIYVHSKIVRIGKSPMDIKLEVWAKDLSEEYEENHHIVTEGVFRYVPIDEEGHPGRISDNPLFPL